MNHFHKAATIIISAMSVCLFSSCMRTDYGLNLTNGIGKNSVYICNSISEDGLEQMGTTKEEFLKKLDEEAEKEGFSRWVKENVNFKTSNGEHYVGTKYSLKVSKNATEKAVKDLVFDYADITYSERSSIGTHTVTIVLTPRGGVWSDKNYSSYVGQSDEDYIDYYFTINVPTKITDTNGTLTNNGKSAEWNLEPLMDEESDYLNMSVTYKDYSLLITTGIVFAIIVIGIIIVFLYQKNRAQKSEFRVTKSSESISSLLAGGEDENTKRCPHCGYKLRIDEAFCVNCGELLETSTESASTEMQNEDTTNANTEDSLVSDEITEDNSFYQ